MSRDERRYPISEEQFNKEVLPIIQASKRGAGRPPKVSHYTVFCGILYIMRTGNPWRDLPKEYGYWHVVYDRFNRGSERGLWEKILFELQKKKEIPCKEVIIDSTTMKIHRQGGGVKGGSRRKGYHEQG